MKCDRVRENLVNSLAAGQSVPFGELALHVRSCAGCRSFYEAESNLLRSIDSSLQSMVNQDIPASLLPGFRTRLSQQPALRRAWVPAWGIASAALAVATVAVLTFTLSRPRQPLESHPSFPLNSSAATTQTSNPAPALPPGRKFEAVPSVSAHRRIESSNPVPDGVPASSEVIVLAEERRAFAKFVARIPQDRAVALALTRPAPTLPEVPIEIALLRIEQMELKPLELEPSN
jgi:hypothetical protein